MNVEPMGSIIKAIAEEAVGWYCNNMGIYVQVLLSPVECSPAWGLGAGRHMEFGDAQPPPQVITAGH